MPIERLEWEELEESVRAALGSRIERKWLELSALAILIFQGGTILLYVFLMDSGTVQTLVGGDAWGVRMSAGPAWIASAWASVVVLAIATVDWLLTGLLLYIFVMAAVRGPHLKALSILILVFLDVLVFNYPYLNLYRNGHWTVELGAQELAVDQGKLFRRQQYRVRELDRLEEICMEVETAWRWRRVLRAKLRFEDGRSDRIVVSGFRVGNMREKVDGLHQALRSALERLAAREGASFSGEDSAGCPGDEVAEPRKRAGVAAEEGAGDDRTSSAVIPTDPFERALFCWVVFLTMVVRRATVGRTAPKDVSGCLKALHLGVESTIGGFLRAVILVLLPSGVIAGLLHDWLGVVRIPGGDAWEIGLLCGQIALLVVVVDGVTELATRAPRRPSLGDLTITLPVFHLLSLGAAWALGWAMITVTEAEATPSGGPLRFFLPAVWPSAVQNAATLGLLMVFTILVTEPIADWRREGWWKKRLKAARKRGR